MYYTHFENSTEYHVKGNDGIDWFFQLGLIGSEPETVEKTDPDDEEITLTDCYVVIVVEMVTIYLMIIFFILLLLLLEAILIEIMNLDFKFNNGDDGDDDGANNKKYFGGRTTQAAANVDKAFVTIIAAAFIHNIIYFYRAFRDGPRD